MNDAQIKADLRRWYRAEARSLPWRERPEPWRVVVSELMLQQTQVATVLPRYEAFMERFPSPSAMADAGEQAVIAAWAGLGFYRRARALFALACALVERHGGAVPNDGDALLGLPGVGAYTAAAIGSIAFGQAVAAVDGNVERVVCRLAADAENPRNAVGKRRVLSRAAELLDCEHPGDHNQAMMDLGARVCTPRSPSCSACPVASHCAGRTSPQLFPMAKKRSSAVPTRVELRVLFLDPAGRTAWRRRPDSGLYSGLPDLPEPEPGAVESLGDADRVLVRRRLSHCWLELRGELRQVSELPPGLEHGSLQAFLAAGPPSAVVALVQALLPE
jgi:A/G-specific adenine glycosylase